MSNSHPLRVNWFEIPVSDLDNAAALHASALGLGIELKREGFFGVPHVLVNGDALGPFGTIALLEDFDGNVVGLHAPA